MLRRTKEAEDEETSQAGGFRTHGGYHAELKALADLPKVREHLLEIINVFAGSPQAVAFKADDEERSRLWLFSCGQFAFVCFGIEAGLLKVLERLRIVQIA